MNSRAPYSLTRSTAPNGDEPIKHVIDVYRHRDQTITCVCGWHGSSAPGDRAGTSRRSGAVAAVADEVEAMVVEVEAGIAGDLGQGRVD